MLNFIGTCIEEFGEFMFLASENWHKVSIVALVFTLIGMWIV